MTCLHDGNLRIQHIADKFLLHAVNYHAEAVAEERVVNLLNLALQCQQAFAACQLGKLNKGLTKLN